MIFRIKYRKMLSSVLLAIILIGFFFTPLSNIIPLARGVSDGWWKSTWPYRKAITINHTEVGGFLDNFPVLIDIKDGNLASSAQDDGDDIVFVDASTNMTLMRLVLKLLLKVMKTNCMRMKRLKPVCTSKSLCKRLKKLYLRR